jgi:hypothetical protein
VELRLEIILRVDPEDAAGESPPEPVHILSRELCLADSTCALNRTCERRCACTTTKRSEREVDAPQIVRATDEAVSLGLREWCRELRYPGQ